MKLNVKMQLRKIQSERCFGTIQILVFVKTCEAGLVLSATRILRAALPGIGQIPCVCIFMCVCNYSSQTTEPICIKIIPANRASDADCYRLLRFEIFTPTIFKNPQEPPKKGRE